MSQQSGSVAAFQKKLYDKNSLLWGKIWQHLYSEQTGAKIEEKEVK